MRFALRHFVRHLVKLPYNLMCAGPNDTRYRVEITVDEWVPLSSSISRQHSQEDEQLST